MGAFEKSAYGQVLVSIRRTLPFFWVLFLLSISAAESLAQEADAGPKSAFEPSDCWAELAGIEKVDCGWVRVPLRWGAPAKRPISLPVVVYRPREADPGLAPVIYLAGGPGQGGLGPNGSWLQGWRQKAARYFPGRKVVVFDQRGVGLGDPRLDCPEIFDPKTRWEISHDPDGFGDVESRWWAAVSACHRRLTAEGWDLGAFNSRQAAAIGGTEKNHLAKPQGLAQGLDVVGALAAVEGAEIPALGRQPAMTGGNGLPPAGFDIAEVVRVMGNFPTGFRIEYFRAIEARVTQSDAALVEHHQFAARKVAVRFFAPALKPGPVRPQSPLARAAREVNHRRQAGVGLAALAF